MKNLLTKLNIPKPWLATWIIFYIAMLISGFIAPESIITTIIKMFSIFLCLVYSIVRFPKDHFLHAAMLATLAADCLLAGTENNTSTLGLTVFFIAQSIHLYRLQPTEHHLLVFTISSCSLLIIILNLFLKLAPPLYLICGFYAISLTLNLYSSWKWYRAHPRKLAAFCAFFGFVLFVCCDLCTSLSFLSLISILPPFFYVPANFFAWFFYYPSQILVSNSTKYVTIVPKEG